MRPPPQGPWSLHLGARCCSGSKTRLLCSGDEAATDPWDVAFAGDGHLVAASMLGEVNQVIVLRLQR